MVVMRARWGPSGRSSGWVSTMECPKPKTWPTWKAPPLQWRRSGRRLGHIVSHQCRRDLKHAVSHIQDVVVCRVAPITSESARTIFQSSRAAPVVYCRACHLCSSLSVDVCGGLLRVGRSGQADISELSTDVTVVTLVDNKGVTRDALGCNVVGVEQVDELGALSWSSSRRGEANVESTGSRCLTLKYVVTVPIAVEKACPCWP